MPVRKGLVQVRAVALRSFTGVPGRMRRGMHFTTTQAVFDALKKRGLVKKAANTKMIEPVEEVKAEAPAETPEPKRKNKSKSKKKAK